MLNPRSAYVLDYFRKLYQIPPDIEIGHGTRRKRINIALGNWEYFDSHAPYPAEKVIWKDWRGQKIPLLLDTNPGLPLLEQKAGKAFINYDILASAFFFLSGWQEYEFMKKNPAPRFPYSESLQKKLNIAHIPVVNYYFDLLKEAVETVHNRPVARKLFDKPTLCLTHDIDRIRSGWKEGGWSELKKGRLYSPVKLLIKRVFGQDAWFNFIDIMNLEKKYQAHSSFYFLTKKGRSNLTDLNLRFDQQVPREFLFNADYDVRERAVQDIFEKIEAAGSEIGEHGSFGTHIDLQILKEDLEKIGRPVAGGRFHNLLFDRLRTFEVLEKSGLKYDSTLGFAEEPGFRNGTIFPFQAYNFETEKPYEIVEIPLVIMDTTFRIYKKMPQNQIFDVIKMFISEAEKFNGVLTILWHNNYFSPYKFAGWLDIYETVLNYAQKKNCELVSGKDVYKNFMVE